MQASENCSPAPKQRLGEANMISKAQFLDAFPFSEIRVSQDEAGDAICRNEAGVIIEMPTGEGKTAVGMAALRAFAEAGVEGSLFFTTPSKTLVGQIQHQFGESAVSVAYGRSEYECLYYTDRKEQKTAQESPCYLLKCPHRLDKESGKPVEEGAAPCPYYDAKYRAAQHAKQHGIVACTTAFFLTNRTRVHEWRENTPACVVVDEAHRIADIARNLFEYTVTDRHVHRIADIVERIYPEAGKVLRRFVRSFQAITRKRPSRTPALLEQEDVARFLEILGELDTDALTGKIATEVEAGRLDPVANSEELKTLEHITLTIPKLVKGLTYALDGDQRKALNYVVAYYVEKDDPESVESPKKARYQLTVRAYFVAPLIQRALGKYTIAMSATVGDEKIFGFESGIKLPKHEFQSGFSVNNTRIFMPTDTANLSVAAQKRLPAGERRRGAPNKELRRVVETAKDFAAKGKRSLVIVISNDEREKFLKFAAEAELHAVSYGNGRSARVVAAAFKGGEGDVLVGTAAQYGEGVDLPKGIAPVIFFLRPGFPRPDDPQTQFEKRRFSDGHCWALWMHRVMLQALQVRGRNVRSSEDVGVCFFVSQGFRKFLFNTLPKALQDVYRGTLTWDECVQEAETILK